jgi:NADPH:quinone reductase-like Zn-dependent oxidoreductase
MQKKSFNALVVEETSPNSFTREIRSKNISDLPAGDLLIRVHYSSLNYKDALSATGNRGVTKHYPHVPGIDGAGVVEESTSAEFKPGDKVIATGFDLGMNTSGGYGQYIRIPAQWALHCPENLSLRESMIYGTAGFTAAQSVERLTTHPVLPEQGKILISGATGGVGSIAVSIMAKLGYSITAVSGKPKAKEFLTNIGATEIISSYGGVVTCCGNVASPELPLSVYPFILRGVSLLGIDSAKCPIHIRQKIWQKLAGKWKIENLDSLATECKLSEFSGIIEKMLRGQQTGRVIVNLL